MSSKSSAKDFKHPYYPWDLKLKNYVPNEKSALYLGTVWGLIVALIFIVAWVLSGRRKEQFCVMRRLVLCWLLLCTVVHIVIDGYFAAFHATLAGDSSFLGESWKEYAKGDSRFLTSDPFLICKETFTALIDGPLAFITFYAFLYGTKWRYASQMVLSVCQLLECGLYFTTEIKDGFIHGPGPKSSNKIPFFGYFVGCNLLWIVIPLALIYDAWNHIVECQHVSDFYIDEYNSKRLSRNKYKLK